MTLYHRHGRTILTQMPDPSPFAYEVNDLEAWSIGNWLLIPEPERRLLLDHLRAGFDSPDGTKLLAKWREDLQAGCPIGEGETLFHFGIGMWVRNRLRGVMTDDKLPLIRQSSGSLAKNWDDFYIGALHALVTETVAPVPTDSPLAPSDMAFTDTVEVSDSGKVTIPKVSP